MWHHKTCTILLPGLILFIFSIARQSGAAGIHADVALTPSEGGTIIRAQWRYSELSGDRTSLRRKAELSVNPFTLVYGVSEDFTILGTVPLVHRQITFGDGRKTSDSGVADISLLAKYRFYQNDGRGQTTRWAAIGGVQIPTYDAPFSSDSFDPIIGMVWTHQQRNWWIDWDLLYQLNTGGGLNADDELRGDIAVSYLLSSGEATKAGPWGLYVIGEINALYLSDGSLRTFGSPGIQFVTPRWILEAGIQVPVQQKMARPRLETDFTFVLSGRFQF